MQNKSKVFFAENTNYAKYVFVIYFAEFIFLHTTKIASTKKHT